MATTAIPPGGTLIQTFKRSFVDVPVDSANDNAISTSEFLEAAESLPSMFGTVDCSSVTAWPGLDANNGT